MARYKVSKVDSLGLYFSEESLQYTFIYIKTFHLILKASHLAYLFIEDLYFN